jgi:PAS domain S-box-containing protein
LVSAEWARLEGRDIEAMQLYEQAIRSAAERGFLQDRALAGELAARFYRLRGLDKVADTYLDEARDCYVRWGALAKVAQLDQVHPRVRQQAPLVLKPTIEAPVEQFDLAMVIKVSQAVAGEIVLEKLIETLMIIAIEHAGANRGLLILAHGGQFKIEAEAKSHRDGIRVHLLGTPLAPSELPMQILEQVIRTQSHVILDDARGENAFADDEYICRKQARSLLCLPLLKQAKLIGVLYLENSLASHVFTPARIAVLKLLASQAAIALENARLYRDVAEREAKIRRLVDSNIIGIFIWDFEGRVLEANDEFLRMVKYDRKDLVAGRIRWADLTPPGWRDRNNARIEQQKTSGRFEPFEEEYTRKDGSRVPVLIGGATFEEGGNQAVAFVLDLTERKRAEERLRAQHTVAQILAGAATIEEAAPRILQAMGECLGWDVGALWRVEREAEALHCVELWHKASIKVPEFERVSREFTFVPGVGLPGRVWSSLAPEYISDVVPDENFPRASIAERERLHAAFGFPILLGGEILGVIEFFSREIRQPDQDLLNMLATIGSQIGQFIERKRAEEALQRSEGYLAEAEKLTHTGSWAWDPRTEKVLYCSEEMFRIFGLDPRKSSPSRENFRQQIHPEDRDWVKKRFEESLRERVDSVAEYRVLLPDGTVRHINASGHVVLNEDGEPIEFIGTAVDVTERRLASEALREVQMELAHANRVVTMGQLTSSIAHEVNQPITAAVTYALAARRWLSAKPPDFGEVSEALAGIITEGNRASEVIGRIRALIRKAPPRKDAVSINNAILEVVALTRTEAANNGVSVRTQLAEGLPPVQGDRVQLQQVLLNLIINGIEAMRDVGQPERELLISTSNEPDGVSVEVRDSGPGFVPAALERVFEAFYTTKPGGLGLGLSMCRSIIEAHNGQLWASANLPRGASFQFVLPAIADTAS